MHQIELLSLQKLRTTQSNIMDTKLCTKTLSVSSTNSVRILLFRNPGKFQDGSIAFLRNGYCHYICVPYMESHFVNVEV